MGKQYWMNWLVAMVGEVEGSVSFGEDTITVVIDSNNFICLPGAGVNELFEAIYFVQAFMLKAPKPQWFGVYIDYPIPFVV